MDTTDDSSDEELKRLAIAQMCSQRYGFETARVPSSCCHANEGMAHIMDHDVIIVRTILEKANNTHTQTHW